jgi:phospholipid transport system substrate-binding protein
VWQDLHNQGGVVAVGLAVLRGMASASLQRRRAHMLTRTRILVAAALLMAAPATAGADTPTQTLKRLNDKVTKLLNKKTKPGTPADKKNREEVKKLVNTLLDYPELAKLSLGKHWAERTEKQRNEFTALLRDLIERNYVKQLKGNLGYKLEYGKETVNGDQAEVKTTITITKNDRPTEIQIDYKLRKQDGRWMVYDVITDDVSIVKNYRSQFNRIIKRESYDALVKKMRRKLDEDGSKTS